MQYILRPFRGPRNYSEFWPKYILCKNMEPYIPQKFSNPDITEPCIKANLTGNDIGTWSLSEKRSPLAFVLRVQGTPW